MTQKTAIIASSDSGIHLAKSISKELPGAEIFSSRPAEGITNIESVQAFIAGAFTSFDNILFIGALGICVRSIAPHLANKQTDPAVINTDVNGAYIQPVLSGHVGGANQLAQRIARITGGLAVITTTSDTQSLWALDIVHRQFGWKMDADCKLTSATASFVNEEPVALLLEARDKGTAYLEKTCPEHVTIFYKYSDIELSNFKLFIAVSPFIHNPTIPSIFYRPPMIALGAGCRKDVPAAVFASGLINALKLKGVAANAIASINTIDIKKDETALVQFAEQLNVPLNIFTAEELSSVNVPNPSQKVFDTVGCRGVAEASALISAHRDTLFIEKEKTATGETNNFTFAAALLPVYERCAFIHIVGAGPGDPELVSVRGKRLLQQADLILYAGSLVPEELTHYAKPGATVLSSAGMNLEEQIACMDEFYSKGLMIVRLHTGDPCLYGAIQEQMGKMDEMGMQYAITPGISAFQAAAAQLQSQFTVPERVQSIILTRGEGRTPMPEKEQLHKLAQSQSTMCIYLSATLVDQVQKDLLVHYPAETPVAVCHKLTWPEEKIWRGKLCDLAQIVHDNKLTLTTLLVVGEAIGARGHYSKLYDKHFTHGTRKAVAE